MNKICKNHPNCVNCPLKRQHERDGKTRVYLYCFKTLRATYYADKTWYKENYKYKNIEELEEILIELYEDERKVEEQEIEISEEDLL